MELIFTDDAGNRVSRSEFHLFIDARSATRKRAPKDAWETEHVIDLIRIVGTTGGHHGHIRRSIFGHDLRRWIRHSKYDWPSCHQLHIFNAQNSRYR